jgi:hypothetical protein
MTSNSSRASGKPAGITSKTERVDLMMASEQPMSKAQYIDSEDDYEPEPEEEVYQQEQTNIIRNLITKPLD